MGAALSTVRREVREARPFDRDSKLPKPPEPLAMDDDEDEPFDDDEMESK